MRTSPSNVSLVLRLLTEPAGRGHLVGHAEVVDTGELVAVHSAEELLSLVQRLAQAPVVAR